MNQSASRKPFRILSDVAEEDRPRWRVRTQDNEVRGPLSDRGLRALVEVGILTETASLAGENADDFAPISDHPIWAEIRPEKTALTLKKTLTLSGSRPPMTGSPFAPAPGANASSPANLDRESAPPMSEKIDSGSPFELSTKTDDPFLATLAMRERQAQAAMQERAKAVRKFRILRAANRLRMLRDLFVLGIFLAVGDLLREGFAGALASARWLLVFGVLLVAMVYYIFSALQD